MHTVTFIDACNVIHTISTPSRAAAITAYVALRCAGYCARMWAHGKAGALKMIA